MICFFHAGVNFYSPDSTAMLSNLDWAYKLRPRQHGWSYLYSEGYDFFGFFPLQKQPVDDFLLYLIVGITCSQSMQSIVTEGSCAAIKILSQLAESLGIVFQIARQRVAHQQFFRNRQE